MSLQLKTVVAALPLASLLWLTPPASAHESYHSQGHQPSWSNSVHRHHPYSGRYNDYQGRYNDWGRRGYDSSGYYGKDGRKYNKAMNRLARQEREARERAYRRYEGNRRDPRYWERLAEIDRKYDRKRYQVERNLRND